MSSKQKFKTDPDYFRDYNVIEQMTETEYFNLQKRQHIVEILS